MRIEVLYYVYAYSMSKWHETEEWSQLLAHRVCSYHEDISDAAQTVTDLINYDRTNDDECFAIGSVPLGSCHDFNLA